MKLFLSEDQKEKSLLSNRIIIRQVPANYDVNYTKPILEESKESFGKMDDEVIRIERKDPSYFDYNICEYVGCNKQITVAMEVDAGKLGKIKLSLCDGCADRFAVE